MTSTTPPSDPWSIGYTVVYVEYGGWSEPDMRVTATVIDVIQDPTLGRVRVWNSVSVPCRSGSSHGR